MANPPLVSVITPVLNGSRYLGACLASVRDQTYQNWEHVVVDNASDDDSCAIVRQYAERDPRFRLVACDDRLPIMPNWNRSVREMAPSARYFKMIHHDDLLMPECLERMVALAELHPNVGLVGAYCERNGRIDLEGIPVDRAVVPGREVAGAYLRCIGGRGGYRVLGTPTSTMWRADLVRAHQPFYDEANELHADVQVCLDRLGATDFGFVHQVLTVTRMHEEQQTTRSLAFASIPVDELASVVRYGPEFLDEDEHGLCVDHALRVHDRVLAAALLQQRPKGFWAFHWDSRRALGHPIRPAGLARAVAAEVVDLFTHPRQTLQRVRRRLGGLGQTESLAAAYRVPPPPLDRPG